MYRSRQSRNLRSSEQSCQTIEQIKYEHGVMVDEGSMETENEKLG